MILSFADDRKHAEVYAAENISCIFDDRMNARTGYPLDA